MNAFLSQTLIHALQLKVVEILNFVMNELKAEHRAQGHTMTGALEESMRAEVTALTDGVMGIIYVNDYYKFLDKGVSAARIPFNPGSGQKRSKYIDGLIRFFRLKLNLGEDQAKGAAFATAYKHKQEGMPTRGSYAFSNNGRRLDFFTGTINRNQKQIQDGVEELFAGAMQNVIQEMNSKLIGEITLIL